MNLDSLSYTLSQISYLVANLSKKNYKSSVQEITDAIQLQGFEADRHLLRCLFSLVDLKDIEGPRNTSHKDYYQVQLLVHQCKTLLNKPSLISILCFALDNPLTIAKPLKPSIQLFLQLSRILHLSPVQEVVFGLVCLESTNYSTYALEFVKLKLPELIKSYTNSDFNTDQVTEGGLHDSSPEVLHLILSQVFTVNKIDFGISKESKEVLLQNLQRDFPLEVAPVLLAPLIYPDKLDCPMDKINLDTSSISNTMLDSSLADLIMEMGYSVCVSIEECRRNLISVSNGSNKSIIFGAPSIAKVLSMMICTHSILDRHINLPYWPGDNLNNDLEKNGNIELNTWNVEVFVQTINDLNPSLSWLDVIKELDHAEFIVKDRKGLAILFSALRLGLNRQGYQIENFPIEMIYRNWSCSEAQMSLVQHILQNSDIFCFADYPYRSISIDLLKVIPETDNKDINNWYSIELVDLMIFLAEQGLCYQVQECLKFPAQKCPDLLALALIQSNRPLSMVRHEMISGLIPVFLGNHSNSAVILHYAWNHQNVGLRHTLVQAMSEWYVRSDQDHVKLSRILDIAQDLKALSLLLSIQQFSFVIDLACLASRREYLKLDKWLSDKIREHGESFMTSCLKFLQKRCPQLIGSTIQDDNLSKYTPISSETVITMLNCLRNVNTGTISQELSETLMLMVTNCTNIYISKVASSRVNPSASLPSILCTSQQQRPIEGSSPQVLVDQLTGLATSLANLGLNPSAQSASTFTLPGSLVQTSSSPSRNIISSSGHSGFSLKTSSSINTSVPTLSSQLSGSSNLLGRLPSHQVTPSVIGKMNHTIDNSLFLDSNMPLSVPKDIEDEANSYFQRIYNLAPHHSLSIDEVLEMLKRFQESHIKREREVFCCMLRNLFEEYRFFPAYPEKELITTAHLFGGIIEHGLVLNYKALGLALRFILDALKKSPNSKMYNFGITALDRFRNRLKDYHQYCSHISSIPHFQQFPQHLIEYVEYGKNSQEPPSSRVLDIVGTTSTLPQVPFMPNTLGIFKAQSITATTTTTTVSTASSKLITTNAILSSRPSIANTTNIDTLLVATEQNAKLIVPPENVLDKIAFIFNNLSQINLQTKCDEIKEIITDDYLPWLSQYLVMKRVSIELNFHTLYSNFLDCLGNEELNTLIISETFRNIRVLLRSDKGMSNFSDRSLLKNLGHWLGMITLAKNKPLLLDDIDLKMLLVEAYNKGHQELLFTVPFIAKVLESCAKSKVFKPRNPWTMSVVNCLAELHQEPDLKLTLKFEVEVLCKALNIDLKDLNPGFVLKDPEIAKKLEPQLSNGDYSKVQVTSVLDTAEQPKVSVSITLQNNNTPIIQTQPTTNPLISQSMTSNTRFNDELVGHVVAAGGVTAMTSTGSVGISGTPIMSPPLPSTEPKFNYVTFNTANSSQLLSMIVINSHIPLFINQPSLKTYIRVAIEKSIQEWINPVVERSVKIAVITTEHIVKKDFGMDSDETHLRKAAHCMVRNLTSGLAMITCREQITQALTTNLKQHFLSILISPTQAQKEMIDQACTICVNDNLELACAFVQKTATEKAVVEIDKYLKNEYERRNLSRIEGRRYCDQTVVSGQAEFLPDTLRNKLGLPPSQMIGIYEEFARNIPGFQQLDREAVSLFMPKAGLNLPPDEISLVYEKLINEIEDLLQLYMSNQRILSNTTQAANLHGILEVLITLRRCRDVITAANVINKVVESYLDGLSSPSNQDLDLAMKYRDLHLSIFRAFQDPRAYNLQWTNKTLTKAIVESRDELRFNLDAIDVLIRAGMVNISMYDMHLALSMDNGTNYVSMAYVKQFLQYYLIDNRSNSPITEIHLQATIDALNTIILSGRPVPDGLAAIIEVLRSSLTENTTVDRTSNTDSNSNSSTHIQHGILQERDFDDPPGLLEKTEYLLKEWLTIYSASPNRDPGKTFSVYIHQMNVQGILKSDDIITRFFRLSTQMMVELCYRQIPNQTQSPSTIRAKLFHTIDAYVKLIVLLVKHSGDANAITTKINLLNKVLGIIVGVLLQDHDVQATDFHQLPYHRILVTLFLDLNTPDPVLESINYPILAAFCHTFHLLRPKKVPGFAYAWLELISHRIFIGRLLGLTPQQKRQRSYDQAPVTDVQGWNFYAQLLIDLFKYLAPFLRNAELAKPVHLLYKGTLRILLILLHDFPEFLCEFHYGFCDVIPPNCIQMRNLILSAFPRNMRLPDPFTPNLKVDILQEISLSPKISPDFQCYIQPTNFKKDLDLYLKTRAPVTFLSEIRSTMQQSCCEPGMRYNLSLLNAIVLYVGTQAIQHIRSKGLVPNTSTIAHSAHMDIFQNLSVDLDTEGRYLFLNAIANQLRFPNSHTHYFSCTLLYLFAEANSEAIQEQITRVLLERLIVNRPHPWGLLITFIELIKNPAYKFWQHEFVHCAPEIEKLFESVARSCMVHKQSSNTKNGIDLPII
ncbi:CCR4-NOT transcription complex subunit 1-like isoform X2 [Daktulosphaira vitifoliae]|uniref:CCR4-NOT transcription complex subunit 1-like isoform X2 n=1 Tax=Daktulosphaira vitifoliae TaxID=58002 RepID=UPI0021AAA949|nr:CCR4-NOT transcription complex subunit 1-like isoform X2 [Daktulosphaira vitifoliae]